MPTSRLILLFVVAQIALALLLLACPGQASAGALAAGDTPACLGSCGATAQSRAQNPVPVQACLIRCEAARRYQAEQRPALAAAAAGRSGRPLQLVTAGAMPPAGPALRWGAIYAAAPPAPLVGIALGELDRLVAHAQASQRCNGARDAGCRMLVEFTERCAAVAQSRRLKGILLTNHPSTYEVAAISTGTGPSQAAAEAAAWRNAAGGIPRGMPERPAGLRRRAARPE